MKTRDTEKINPQKQKRKEVIEELENKKERKNKRNFI
jgi:hypothetical protein